MAATIGIAPIETPEEPGLDLNANQSPRIVAASIALLAIPTVIVGLRFVARSLSKAGLWWDDWMVLAALVVSWGPNVIGIYTTTHGFGQHIAALGDPLERISEAEWWFQMLYAYQTLYTVAITLAKYSILLFYSRIFKERKFQLALRVVFALVTAWFIAVEIVSLAECVPISALWDPLVTGQCIDILAFFKGAGGPNAVFNFVILVMPLPMIWSLEIDTKHKLALSGVFLLGGFVVVVSIIRLVILANVQIEDVTWEFVNAAIWTSAEPSIAVSSASLPILRSLFVWGGRMRSVRKGGATSPDSYDEPKEAANRYRRDLKNRHHGAGGGKRMAPITLKKDGSFSSQQFPLTDLPANSQHAFGNRVVVASGSGSRKVSDEDVNSAWAGLPIMHPQEAAYAANYGNPNYGSPNSPPIPPSYRLSPDNRSELQG